MKRLLLVLVLGLFGVARADQFSTGHSFGVETVTAQKLNDLINKATAQPGLVGEQTLYTGDLDPADDMLLRRQGTNTLVRVTIEQVQTPAGTVIQYAGNTVPTGWLACDGSAVSRATYATLFAAIGVTYGAGDGSTTFNLPDARGRAVAGLDTQVSGTYANRLTLFNSQTLGNSGGAQNFTLTTAYVPVPSLSLTTDNGYAKTGSSVAVTGGSLSFAGAANPVPIVQPTLVLRELIKY